MRSTGFGLPAASSGFWIVITGDNFSRRGSRRGKSRSQVGGIPQTPSSGAALDRMIQTKPGPHEVLHPGAAEADAGRIRGHYLSLGYFEAKIPPPRIDLSEDGTRATVRFQVEEGEPAKVGAVRVEGNGSIPSQ